MTNSSRAPTISLCRIEPQNQKRRQYQPSDNRSYEYQDIFDTYIQDSTKWKPTFIKQILYVEDQVKLEGQRLPDDFIQNQTRTVLVDYTRFGFCFAFDLSAVAKMIPQMKQEYLPNFLFILDSGVELAAEERVSFKFYSVMLTAYLIFLETYNRALRMSGRNCFRPVCL